jgi:hypothetical protein
MIGIGAACYHNDIPDVPTYPTKDDLPDASLNA